MSTPAMGQHTASEASPPEVLQEQQPTVSTSSTTEDRRITFRKRRLSLPLHHLSTEDNHVPASSPQMRARVHEEGVSSSPCTASESPILEADDKAHTFRKRRLSLTQNKCHLAESPDRHYQPPNKRPRRSSETSSIGSTSSSRLLLSPKTMHAAELIPSDRPPPSPAVNGDNVLYTKPSLPPPPAFSLPPSLLSSSQSPTATTAEEHAMVGTPAAPDELDHHQQPTMLFPKWHRRQTIEQDHKLPFPKEVVGTYSCHGVEPVYDSSYEEEEEEDGDNEEDGVVDDFWHAGIGKPVAAILSVAHGLEETAADDNNSPKEEEKESPATTLLNEPTVDETTNPDNHLTADSGTMVIRPTTAAKINQDRGGVAYPYGNSPHTALFAVYDGHGQGGELVSQFALHEIQRRLEKHPDFGTNLDQALKDTFCAVDEALKQEPIIEPLFAGTTACVVLLSGHRLTMANAGDSRAVLARRCRLDDNHSKGGDGELPLRAIDLTQDQNPDTPDEMERILASGGFVSPSPGPGLSARVWLDSMCTQIGLAMARSIGDHAVSTVGVIAEPVVTCYDVQENDQFMILASDGVWEFLESQDAVRIVGENLHRGSTKACQALIEAAAAKWHEEEGEYRDDITAIVVQLQHLWDNEKAKG